MDERIKTLRSEPVKKITHIRYTMTWRCDSKCVSCNIWKMDPDPSSELTPQDISNFTKSDLLKDVNAIVFSGGEPTLRNDFPEIVLALHKNLKKARFMITLNGNHPEKTYTLFKKIQEQAPELKWNLIGISLNGPEEMHDASRGVPGSFKNAVRTAELLKEFCGCVEFSFTFLKNNVKYFKWVHDFGKSKGVGVHICWTVMNDRFNTNEEDLVFYNDPSLISVLDGYVGLNEIKWGDDFNEDFFKYKTQIVRAYLYDSILNKRVVPCHACKTFFHLAPNGDVYPCDFKLSKDRNLGNVKEKSFDDIWNSVPPSLFAEIKEGKCMYPNGVCGDSDIFRSIRQVDTPVYEWYLNKRKNNKKLIEKES